MPKNRKVVKTATGGSHRYSISSKLRIGTRSGGVSALAMSSDALKDVLNSDSKRRYHQKARAVLTMRGIAVDWQEQLVDTDGGATTNDSPGSAAV